MSRAMRTRRVPDWVTGVTVTTGPSTPIRRATAGSLTLIFTWAAGADEAVAEDALPEAGGVSSVSQTGRASAWCWESVFAWAPDPA